MFVGVLHEAPALMFPFAQGRILMRPYARFNCPYKPQFKSPLRKEKPMRVLAIFAFSFAGAVLAANYWLPEDLLFPLGLLFLLLGGLAFALLKNRRRPRKWAALVCGGLALGLFWTAAYTVLFFQPARALDDRTVRLTATVADWPQETDYGYSLLVRADTDSFVDLNTILYTD